MTAQDCREFALRNAAPVGGTAAVDGGAEDTQALEAQREATQQVERRAGRIVRHVFHRGGEPVRDFRKAWERACVAAGCPGRLLHDFRRTAVPTWSAAASPSGSPCRSAGTRRAPCSSATTS